MIIDKNIIIGASHKKEGHCGYCGQSKSTTYGLYCQLMEPRVYEKLMFAGFRRCGEYFYRYDVPRNCCAVFSIFLQVKDFTISKSQRTVVRRCEKRFSQTQYQAQKKPKQEKLEMPLQEIQIQGQKEIQEKAVLLHRYFDQQLLSQAFLAVQSAFQITTELQKLQARSKVLPCKNKKGEFSSNYWLMFFGVIKKVNKKLELKSVISTLRPIVNATSHELIKYRLQENGYLSLSLTQLPKERLRLQKPKSLVEQQIIETGPQTQVELNFGQNEIRMGRLQIKIIRACFEKQSFLLYRKFSQVVHQKMEETEDSYSSFLCGNSLGLEDSQGSFHFKYLLEGRLIAVGVCDLTPSMLSSVYFFYDPAFKDLSLGVFSQLVQISYVKNRNLREPGFKYYTMGFYIQANRKMSYKGDLHGSRLLCPVTFNLVELTRELRETIDQIITKRIWPQLSKDQTREAFALKQRKVRQELVLQSRLQIRAMRLQLKDLRVQLRERVKEYLESCLRGVGKQTFAMLTFSLG